jgi:hypothetical protein
MVTDIRKLQILNSLIGQTLEVLERRTTGYGQGPFFGPTQGLEHLAAFGQVGTGFQFPYSGQNQVTGQGFGGFGGFGTQPGFGTQTYGIQPGYGTQQGMMPGFVPYFGAGMGFRPGTGW